VLSLWHRGIHLVIWPIRRRTKYDVNLDGASQMIEILAARTKTRGQPDGEERQVRRVLSAATALCRKRRRTSRIVHP
jgi:hypothetical protein